MGNIHQAERNMDRGDTENAKARALIAIAERLDKISEELEKHRVRQG